MAISRRGKQAGVGKKHRFNLATMQRKDGKFSFYCSHCKKRLTYGFGIEVYLHGVFI